MAEKKDRVILHADFNNFYASVECMLNPKLKGHPVAVGGDVEARHGIILAKCILRRRTAAGAVTNGRCAVSAARIFQRLSGVNGKG